MGCYSFYRIIKDVIKTIFGRKIWKYTLIILIAFTIFFFLGEKGVFANFTGSWNNKNFDLPDLPENGLNLSNEFIIFKWSSTLYEIIFSPDLESSIYSTNGQDIAFKTDIYSNKVLRYRYDSSGSFSWSPWNVGSYIPAGGYATPGSSGFVYSTVDIKNRYGTITYFQGEEYNPIVFVYPFISTPITEIQDLSYSNLFIELGDWNISNPLYLHRLQIDNTVTDGSDTIYYYTDYTIRLDSNSTFYTQFANSNKYYFSIPKNKFNFNINTNYLFVLSDNSDNYNNSTNLIQEDDENGVFQVVQFSTTGVLTPSDVTNNTLTNIDDNLNDDTVSSDTETEIDNVFNYDISNDTLTNNHNGFFSRLMALFSSMYDYNLSDDTVINIPVPHSNKNITLHSNIISSHIVDPLRSIISAFWMYVFYLYAWKFLNYMLIEIQEGKILDDKDTEVPGTLSANIF